MNSTISPSLMRTRELPQRITAPAAVAPGKPPFSSWYLDTSRRNTGSRHRIEERIEALREGLADTLVMAGTYEREPCCVCGRCGQTRVQPSLPRSVPACGRSNTEPLDLRLELLRLASRQGAGVMVVDSDEVLHTDGVDCLRRYRAESSAEPLPRRGEVLDLVA